MFDMGHRRMQRTTGWLLAAGSVVGSVHLEFAQRQIMYLHCDMR